MLRQYESNRRAGPIRRWAPRAMLIAAAALASAPARGAPDAATLESQVKSAFVLNFVQFIDWPEGAFERPDAPILIGVVGAERLSASLTAAVEAKTIKGRKIQVRAFAPGAIGPCHVLVAGSGVPTGDTLKAAGGKPTLTIGEADDFTDGGGVIRFYIEDRKVRFEINLAAAERARLQISSKLLKLAKVVNK